MLETYRKKLTEHSKITALNDSHSYRTPRYCGLTVHFATGGCPYRCSYCYIYDMGFGYRARPYPLNPEELVFAILNNKNFVSGRYGTLIAVGSVTEPFLFEDTAIGFLEELSKLGNPIQFSTKKYLNHSLANKISELPTSISALVSITTIDNVDVLEPYAPSVDKRLGTIYNLSSAGVSTCLFLRPIIVGVNDSEIPKIIDLAIEHGARCVVIGSFRITYHIYTRLKKLGVNLDKIEARINVKALRKRPKTQYVVPLKRKEKARIIRVIRNKGAIPFLSACCANSYSASVICPSICFETNYCTSCPNDCRHAERPEVSDVLDSLRILGLDVNVVEKKGKLFVDRGDLIHLIRVLSRRLTYPAS